MKEKYILMEKKSLRKQTEINTTKRKRWKEKVDVKRREKNTIEKK